MQPGPAAGRVLRAVGRALRAQWPWRVFCGCLGAVALACSVNVRACCMSVFSVRSGPVAVVCPGGGWGESYSSCGRAPIADCVFCVWSRPVALCVARPSCGVYFAYGRGLLCGACAVRRWVPVALAYSC